jgi:hypothetical protein
VRSRLRFHQVMQTDRIILGCDPGRTTKPLRSSTYPQDRFSTLFLLYVAAFEITDGYCACRDRIITRQKLNRKVYFVLLDIINIRFSLVSLSSCIVHLRGWVTKHGRYFLSIHAADDFQVVPPTSDGPSLTRFASNLVTST